MSPEMLPQEIIRRKRNGEELSGEEISYLIARLADGTLTDGQAAAFAMAVFFRGMSTAELVALTLTQGWSSSGTNRNFPVRSSTSIQPAALAIMFRLCWRPCSPPQAPLFR
jgi:thymidine phosphorylase